MQRSYCKHTIHMPTVCLHVVAGLVAVIRWTSSM